MKSARSILWFAYIACNVFLGDYFFTSMVGSLTLGTYCLKEGNFKLEFSLHFRRRKSFEWTYASLKCRQRIDFPLGEVDLHGQRLSSIEYKKLDDKQFYFCSLFSYFPSCDLYARFSLWLFLLFRILMCVFKLIVFRCNLSPYLQL